MSDSFAKRRKLDDAAAVLTRPFRSPLKYPRGTSIGQPTPDGAGGVSMEHSLGNNDTITAANLATTAEPETFLSAQLPTINNSSPSQALIQPHPAGTTINDPSQPGTAIPDRGPLQQLPKSNKTPIPGQARQDSVVDDPKIAALHRQNRALELRVRNLRTDIDTLSQAAKIEASPRDDELRVLIDKWRTASRTAAEELFAGAKDRVNRMGGVGAWREAERSRRARQRAWEEEARAEAVAAEYSSDGPDASDDGSEAENGKEYEQSRIQRWELRQQRREQREAVKEESRSQARLEAAEESNPSVEEAGETGDEHDAFTMDMMLRTMQIDLNLIGWDKEAQKWV